jgi:hypothetical protein
MRAATAHRFALLILLAACGSKTSLSVGAGGADGALPDTAPPPIVDRVCEEDGGREPFTVATDLPPPRVAGEGRVWFAGRNFNAPLGYVGRDGGEGRVLRPAEPVVTGFVVDGARPVWLTVGFGDTTGELLAWFSGETRTLARGFHWPGSLHLAGDHFYFADGTNSGSLRDEMRGRVLRIRRSGRGDVETLAQRLWLPTSIAVRGDFVYWVDTRRGELGRVRRSGGEPEIIASGFTEPRNLVAREPRGLFFSDGATLLTVSTDDGVISPISSVAELGDRIDHLYLDEVGIFVTLRDDSANDRLVWLDWLFTPTELEENARGALGDETRIYWYRPSGSGAPSEIRAICRAALR